MAAPTMERQKTTGYRRVANSRVRQDYRDMKISGNTVTIPDYTRPFPGTRSMPKAAPKAAPMGQERKVAYKEAKRKQIIRTTCQIAVVFLLCSLMIYRYAMILESNNAIDKMTKQVTQMEYDNQYMVTKLESNLELGTLEKFATEELGMMHPETGQIFYVDVSMKDEAVMEDSEQKGNLQGAPGALMHAICVLK